MEEDKSHGFMVFWIYEGMPKNQHFPMEQMSLALNFMEMLRADSKFTFITFVSQNPQSVGKPGVSDKLPEDYSWSKQHRAGATSEKSAGIGAKSNGV
jgi:hypothetical protein